MCRDRVSLRLPEACHSMLENNHKSIFIKYSGLQKEGTDRIFIIPDTYKKSKRRFIEIGYDTG